MNRIQSEPLNGCVHLYVYTMFRTRVIFFSSSTSRKTIERIPKRVLTKRRRMDEIMIRREQLSERREREMIYNIKRRALCGSSIMQTGDANHIMLIPVRVHVSTEARRIFKK